MERKWRRSNGPPGVGDDESAFAAESALAGVGLVRGWAATEVTGETTAAAMSEAAHARRTQAGNTEYLMRNRTGGARGWRGYNLRRCARGRYQQGYPGAALRRGDVRDPRARARRLLQIARVIEVISLRYSREPIEGDYDGYKASNPTVSPDGRWFAFQSARSTDAAGVGYGIFLYPLGDR